MSDVNISRRMVLKGLIATGVVGFSGAAVYGSVLEPFDYEVTATQLFLRDLAPAFDGFKITQLTDLHHSGMVPLEEVRRVVELANLTRPDMFVLTGDYATGMSKYVEPCAEVLATLNAPEGVCAVLGNHDHHIGPSLTARALAKQRINVLSNVNTRLSRGGETLQLVGIDDWGWGAADWPKALKGVELTQPSIMLSHEPAVLDMPETKGISLILSGHTHGGQISLPLIGPPARFMHAFKYIRGHYEKAGSQLYVSRGTGMIGIPVRIGARPEIAVLTLRRA